MKNQELIKKIEEIAKTFKSRKNVGQSDGKRHDTIRRDEEQMMWVAYKQLDWSCAKIATVFDRGDVTVAKRMERLQKKFTKNKVEQKQGERSLRQKQQIEHI